MLAERQYALMLALLAAHGDWTQCADRTDVPCHLVDYDAVLSYRSYFDEHHADQRYVQTNRHGNRRLRELATRYLCALDSEATHDNR